MKTISENFVIKIRCLYFNQNVFEGIIPENPSRKQKFIEWLDMPDVGQYPHPLTKTNLFELGHLSLRSIESLTDDEAKRLCRLGECHYSNLNKRVRKDESIASPEKWLQVYSINSDQSETIIFNLGYDKNAFSICSGNDYWRTNTRCYQYLIQIGFPVCQYDASTDTHYSVEELVELGVYKIMEV